MRYGIFREERTTAAHVRGAGEWRMLPWEEDRRRRYTCYARAYAYARERQERARMRQRQSSYYEYRWIVRPVS